MWCACVRVHTCARPRDQNARLAGQNAWAGKSKACPGRSKSMSWKVKKHALEGQNACPGGRNARAGKSKACPRRSKSIAPDRAYHHTDTIIPTPHSSGATLMAPLRLHAGEGRARTGGQENTQFPRASNVLVRSRAAIFGARAMEEQWGPTGEYFDVPPVVTRIK